MNNFKRFLIGLGIGIFLLLGTAFALPYLFKDALLAKAKAIINEQINAEVSFEDVSLSLFRHFPDISFGLNALRIQGVDTFSQVTLADIEQLDLTLDLMSVIRSRQPIRLVAIDLHGPILNIRVLGDGRANYNIARPAPASDTSTSNDTPSDFRILLDRYAIHNGQLSYFDQTIETNLFLDGIHHSGSGDFSRNQYDLNTQTQLDRIDLSYGGISYLRRARVLLEAIFSIDQQAQKYSLKDNALTLNALQLIGNGFIQLDGDHILIDLDVKAPSNDFKEVLSLVPGAYLEGYEDVQTGGQFKLQAAVKGTYNAAKSLLPGFDVQLNVDGGHLQYPDLPLGIDQITADARIKSPGNDLDQLTIDLPAFAFRIGNNPLEGRFSLANPISNPTIDTEIKGLLDLAQLSQAFPIEGIDQLQGTIQADLNAQTDMLSIDRGQYESVDMQGVLHVADIQVKTPTYPEVVIQQAGFDFSPRFVAVENLNMQLGKSDLQVSGRVDNILAYFSPERTMTGQLKLRSSLIDANEWVPESTTTSTEAGRTTAPTPVSNTKVFDRFDFSLDAEVGTILYREYELTNTVARAAFSPDRLAITNASTQMGDSDVQISGSIDHIFGYLFEGQNLGGDIIVQSNQLNLNPFMTSYTGQTAEVAKPSSGYSSPDDNYGVLLVPENIDMRLRTKVGTLQYTNLTLEQVAGELEIADQAVALRDVVANAFGGKMGLNGMYSTENPESPAFSVAYEMKEMKFQEAFHALNTFQKLAPIGQFIEGVFTTRLAMDGNLTNNMMPDLSTLNAKGFLETIDGILKSYKPVQSIANTLHINELKDNIRLEDTRNWVEIQDGKVEVKPFDLNLADIPMTIGGSHGLNQEMAYEIKAAIPRARLESNAVGAAASEGLNTLQREAERLGLPFEQSQTVNVMIALSGSITDPKVKLNLLGLDGDETAGDFILGATESLKQEAEAKIEESKAQVKEEATKILDSAQSVAEQEIKKTTDKIQKEATKTVDSLLQEQAKKVLDQTGAKTEVENLKKELEKFNPFKKKKPDSSKKETPPAKKEETKADTTKKKTGGENSDF